MKTTITITFNEMDLNVITQDIMDVLSKYQ